MAAELTGVMGHNAEGDKLAAERERRKMILMPCSKSVVSAEMSYRVITKYTLVTLLFINSQDLT